MTRRFPKIRGTLLRGPHNQDYSILGSILGYPNLGETTTKPPRTHPRAPGSPRSTPPPAQQASGGASSDRAAHREHQCCKCLTRHEGYICITATWLYRNTSHISQKLQSSFASASLVTAHQKPERTDCQSLSSSMRGLEVGRPCPIAAEAR